MPKIRDKMSGKRTFLRKFWSTLEPRSGDFNCIPHIHWFSLKGRLQQRVFLGTKRDCYEAYLAYCNRFPNQKQFIVKGRYDSRRTGQDYDGFPNCEYRNDRTIK